ncbi:MAG: hypothetical protein VYB34_00395 [Planctomycetota bacterium]|nr:hypothetical protein [Planctomycetota bacterium]
MLRQRRAHPDTWIRDGIHPLLQGHELIAPSWLQEINAGWNELPGRSQEPE